MFECSEIHEKLQRKHRKPKNRLFSKMDIRFKCSKKEGLKSINAVKLYNTSKFQTKE